MSLPIAEWSGSIESISQEGMGVGTLHEDHDDKNVRRPIFIPFTVPGDKIEAKVTEQKRKYYFGELRRIVTPSSERVTPPCPHFTVCGGCNLQHVSYDEQLRQKALQIQFLLARKNITLPHDVKVLPSKSRHHYRRRAKIAIEFTGGLVNAGFRKFHAHDIIPIKTCFVVAEEIVWFIGVLNKAESMLGAQGRFTQEVIVIVGENRKLGLLVPLDDTPPEARKRVRDFFEDIYGRNRRSIGNLFFEENRATKTSGQVQEHSTYTVLGTSLAFTPDTFIQSNVSTNELLVSTVLDFLFGTDKRNTGTDVVLDLYAGLGNISLPAAKRAQKVMAVEGHETSVLLGRVNAYQNKLENVTFVHRSTEKYIYEYVKAVKKNAFTEEYCLAQSAIIDPPRTGCTPEVLKGLAFSGLNRIVYVSCNPVTLASDLATLGSNYKITNIVGIDMFPDISHVETVVLLEKK